MAYCTRPLCQVSTLLTPSPWGKKKNYLGINAALSRREIRCSCKALLPLFLRSLTGIRSPYPYFVVYYDRPILVSSLDHWRHGEKLSKKERRPLYEEKKCMTSQIAASARLQTLSGLAHSRAARRSGEPCGKG